MLRMIAGVLRSLARRYSLYKYDDFTIAEYFRRQGAQVGTDCRILIRELGSEPFLVRIGDHCTIAGHVAFITHDGGTWLFSRELPSLQSFGTIDIRDNCFIGYGVTILPDVRIGPNSIVAAGAIVTRDVPPNVVVAGCPARVLCGIEEYRKSVLEAWRTQRPEGYFAGVEDSVHHSSAQIDAFKRRDKGVLKAHLQRTLWSRHNRTAE